VRKCGILLLTLLVIHLFVPIISLDTQANDWPTFQHDTSRQGFSDSEVPDVPHLNWTMEFENQIAGPLVADGKVFIHDLFNYTIYVIDIETKEILNIFNDSYKMGCISNGNIFNLSTSNIFYSVDISTGDINWEFDNPFGFIRGPNGASNDQVFVTSTEGGSGSTIIHFYCLYETNGSIKWIFNFTIDSWSHARISMDGSMVFISLGTSDAVYGGGSVLALDEETGDLIWKKDYPSWVYSNPTINDDFVYFANYEEEIVALDKYGNGDNTTDTIWSFDIGDYTRGSPALGSGMGS
jgi:hypothetical protein